MRKVAVLAEAAEDIEQARNFYDTQEPGIGDYCADSLVADIESLALYHGMVVCDWIVDFIMFFSCSLRLLGLLTSH